MIAFDPLSPLYGVETEFFRDQVFVKAHQLGADVGYGQCRIAQFKQLPLQAI